jgi:hypothetical protein
MNPMNEPHAKPARQHLREVVRDQEPLPPETLDTVKSELEEYRRDQWRLKNTDLMAVIAKRLNWTQMKAHMRIVLGDGADEAAVVAAADRLMGWAEETIRKMQE